MTLTASTVSDSHRLPGHRPLLLTGTRHPSRQIRRKLSISSGAVSIAIKQLIPVGLIERVPAPGSRRDHYRFRAGAWAALMSQQNTMLATMRDAAQEGSDAATPETATATRLHEMQDFYTYMTNELVPLIERWREQYTAEHDSAELHRHKLS
ncbi:MarR family transcriptional regulator [Streptomyces gardneri]|nr:MarR family transcriptional regulator [Streptomyces gardneri]